MIQRIQTIYLIIAASFMLFFYMFPIAIFITDTFSYEFFNCHLTHPENLNPPIALLPLALLPMVSFVLSIVTIFMFKKRKLQMRLGKINVLVIFTTLVSMFLYIYRIDNMLSSTFKYGFSGIFPLIALVLIVFANKAIKYDDELVKSAERIR